MNSWIMHKKSNQSGQAMVEFVIVLPLLMILLIAMYYLSILIHNQQRTAMAARHGAWLIAHGRPKGEVNSSAFKKLFFSDRAVNEGRVSVEVDRPSRKDPNLTAIPGIDKILGFVGDLLGTVAGARTVRVIYKAPDIPYVSAFLPEAASNIQVLSHCTMVDITNTWKSIWDILKNILGASFDALYVFYRDYGEKGREYMKERDGE